MREGYLWSVTESEESFYGFKVAKKKWINRLWKGEGSKTDDIEWPVNIGVFFFLLPIFPPRIVKNLTTTWHWFFGRSTDHRNWFYYTKERRKRVDKVTRLSDCRLQTRWSTRISLKFTWRYNWLTWTPNYRSGNTSLEIYLL